MELIPGVRTTVASEDFLRPWEFSLFSDFGANSNLCSSMNRLVIIQLSSHFCPMLGWVCNVHIMHGLALSVSPTNLLLEERGDPGKGSSCTMVHHVTCIKQIQIVLQSMLTICCFLLHAVVGGGPGNE